MKTLLFLLCLVLAPLAHAQLTKGNAIKATTTYEPDGTRRDLVVDPEKQSAEESFYGQNDKLLKKVVYPLDAQNRSIGSITYDAKGVIVMKSSYIRDASGLIKEETITDAAGKLIRRRIYQYDQKDKIFGMDEYDANGNLLPKPIPASKAGKKRR